MTGLQKQVEAEIMSVIDDILAPSGGLVHDAIERHLPAEQYRVLKVAEQSEQELLKAWIGRVA
jgi:hypothetical protein